MRLKEELLCSDDDLTGCQPNNVCVVVMTIPRGLDIYIIYRSN